MCYQLYRGVGLSADWALPPTSRLAGTAVCRPMGAVLCHAGLSVWAMTAALGAARGSARFEEVIADSLAAVL